MKRVPSMQKTVPNAYLLSFTPIIIFYIPLAFILILYHPLKLFLSLNDVWSNEKCECTHISFIIIAAILTAVSSEN